MNKKKPNTSPSLTAAPGLPAAGTGVTATPTESGGAKQKNRWTAGDCVGAIGGIVGTIASVVGILGWIALDPSD